ncbi:NERD domain-containing protein [Psychrosphaera sp. G1-22]|uniref:NERD domain-containing protein n=2 Tax=Psychrosphaera algicola TaxID=3023714 RepID=A0ABT5FGX8_9GAMM|nr:NERD domain-containing protein [Psychrosphaera sp. G1-22]MDC2890256.1 NERD domain-containing protein [Psychrosphaera sp. G1-22]
MWPAVFLLAKTSNYKGSAGERMIARKLNIFGQHGQKYPTFHDVTLITPDGTTQIDHILISPYGIFVIETKNLRGWIFGGEKQRQWTQTIYKNKYKFYNPILQNYKHVKAIEKLLGANSSTIFNIVVFVGSCQFKTEMPKNVVTKSGLIPLIKSQRHEVLNSDTIHNYSVIIENAISSTVVSKDMHIANIERNKNKPLCPKCGNAMVLRTARKGANAGTTFWGCSGFPTCKVTKKKS